MRQTHMQATLTLERRNPWTGLWLCLFVVGLGTHGLVEDVFSQSQTNQENAHIHVSLKEFSVETNASTVHAGRMTFEAENIGVEIHELVVLRTNIPPANLPQIPDKSGNGVARGMIVNEQDPALETIDEIEEFSAGTKAKKQINLEPGRYVLFCKIPNHYQKGMFTVLHVVE